LPLAEGGWLREEEPGPVGAGPPGHLGGPEELVRSGGPQAEAPFSAGRRGLHMHIHSVLI
jgi:hypothetical protein